MTIPPEYQMDEGTIKRFWSYVFPEPNSGCWLWAGALTAARYGALRVHMPPRHPTLPAHRLSWYLHGGDIPDGYQIDHLCRNRSCVNPAHLEPVTCRENQIRRSAIITHCPKGHPYAGDNLVVYEGSHRYCWTCRSGFWKRNYWERGGKARSLRNNRAAYQRKRKLVCEVVA